MVFSEFLEFWTFSAWKAENFLGGYENSAV